MWYLTAGVFLLTIISVIVNLTTINSLNTNFLEQASRDFFNDLSTDDNVLVDLNMTTGECDYLNSYQVYLEHMFLGR
jgi:hypothetical protein